MFPKKVFLSNDKNKLRLIQLLKDKFKAKSIQVLQAEEDADMFIITIAIRKAFDIQVVIIAGENVYLLVILAGLREPTKGTIYLQNCEISKTADIFYSTTSTTVAVSSPLSLDAFSGCDSTSCFFGQGKLMLLEILQNHADLRKKAAVFSNPAATPAQVVEARDKIIIELYGGKRSSQTSTTCAVISSLDCSQDEFLPSQTSSHARYCKAIFVSYIPPVATVAELQKDGEWNDLPLTRMGFYSPRPFSKDGVDEKIDPTNLLKMICCSYKKGCRNVCSCRKAGLKCSVVCETCSGQSCENLLEITVDVDVCTDDLDKLDDEMDRLLNCPVSQLTEDAIEQLPPLPQNAPLHPFGMLN